MANNLLKPINPYQLTYGPQFLTGNGYQQPVGTFTTAAPPAPNNLTLIHPLKFKMNNMLTITPSDVVIIDFNHGVIRVKRKTGFSIIIQSEHEDKRLEVLRRMEADKLDAARREREYQKYVALQKQFTSDMAWKEEQKIFSWQEEQAYLDQNKYKLNMLSEHFSNMLSKQAYFDFIKIAGEGTFFKDKKNEPKKTATEVQYQLMEIEKRMRNKK